MMLAVIVAAPSLAVWLAVGGLWHVTRRRALRERAAWERLSAGLSGLDTELDRTWAEEQERLRRH